MEGNHLVARVRDGRTNLLEPDLARRLWRALRQAFPLALAVLLMPDHLHLVDVMLNAAVARDTLHQVVSAVTKDRGTWIWEPIPEVERLQDRQRVLRAVRYALINPCRAFLTADPLRWLWSSLRDVHGAVVDPWITPQRLADDLELRFPDFLEWFHGYVVGDIHVAPAAADMPRRARPRSIAVRSLPAIGDAIMLATRGEPADLRRRKASRPLFLDLARQQGWTDTRALGSFCAMGANAVRRAPKPSAADLIAAERCLGDARLTLPVRHDDPRVTAYRADPGGYISRARKTRKLLRWTLTGDGDVERELRSISS